MFLWSDERLLKKKTKTFTFYKYIFLDKEYRKDIKKVQLEQENVLSRQFQGKTSEIL